MTRGWLAAGIATLATIALAGGIIIGYQLGAQRSASRQGLAADFAQLKARLHGTAGIAVTAAGGHQEPVTFGDWRSGPAWSTIKVPLVIAALREHNPPQVDESMTTAITESDNAAAESVWESLGDPLTAARAVQAVLRQYGDPTRVQSQRVRPEFSASGQTMWSLTDQARFTSTAFCDNANAPVFALMGQVTPDQSWGIGTIGGARFKGGWGPSPTSSYLVRQLGILTAPTGSIAIALAAEPDSGRFEDGTADLTLMANWLATHLDALPAGHCDT